MLEWKKDKNLKDEVYVGIAGFGSRFIFSVGGLVVVVIDVVGVDFDSGDNRFKSVRVGGGILDIGDDTPSEMISILIGRPKVK